MLVNIVEKYFIESQVSQFVRVCLCIGGASAQGRQFSVGASAAQCLVPVAVCNTRFAIAGCNLQPCSLATPPPPLPSPRRRSHAKGWVGACLSLPMSIGHLQFHASRPAAHYM